MTILVTGAASGIGAALVAMLGGPVIRLDRVAVAGEIMCDLADPASIAQAAAEINCPLSGIAHVAGLPGTHDPVVVVAVNALAPIALTNALLDRLEAGASIVTVSSVTALRCPWSDAEVDALIDSERSAALAQVAGLDGARAYELSKAAVNRWTMRTASQLQSRGIRTNTVSPGPVETPILDDFRRSIGTDRIAGAEAMTGRHGQPSEVAAVIAFLLSDAARWINGTDIRVDGGYHAIRATAARSPQCI